MTIQGLNRLNEILDLLPPEATKKDKDLITKAYNYAEKAHAGQMRLSGEPYFVHVFETGKTLATLNMDVQTIAAGLLHDTIEDTSVTEADLQKDFGENILFLVKGTVMVNSCDCPSSNLYNAAEVAIPTLHEAPFSSSMDVNRL